MCNSIQETMLKKNNKHHFLYGHFECKHFLICLGSTGWLI